MKMDDSPFQRRIKIAHRPLIEVDDAPGLERPDIAHSFGDRLIGARYKSICRSVVPAKAHSADIPRKSVWFAPV